ncbi:MAG: ubiquitin-conjugating enzyme/RWD-like protein [Monoraphidium minutum]|nr:MAG: ubiquitin-conjugating enzyme/RWD-like protein [Monoraphidium minutum]
MALQNRMAKEIKTLRKKPPEGVCVWPAEGASMTRLCAQVQGPAGTVYEAGVFRLAVEVPERYPFEPPKVTFETRVYHPNIDSSGRVCLDILDLPPKGSWRPSLNLVMVLSAVRQLLAEPNPDDPLDQDATEVFLRNRAAFDAAARRMVAEHASGSGGSESPGGPPRKVVRVV